MSNDDFEIMAGSGNVFRDFEQPGPDVEQRRLDVVVTNVSVPIRRARRRFEKGCP